MARTSPYQPLLIAGALVGGLFIGRYSGSGVGGDALARLTSRGGDPAAKIAQVLDLIERQYVDTVEQKALVEEVLQDILQRLDPHSYYISAEELGAAQEPLEGSFDGIGVEFAIQRDTVVVITPVEGGPSEALGIRAGDRIIAADSVPLAGVGITNDGVMKNLRGPKGSKVTVSILRNGRSEPFQVTIQRGKIPIHSVAASLITPDGTGYIKLVRFARNTHDEFLAAADALREKGMQRLVLDLRGNGGGYLNSAIQLADEFLPDGRTIVYTQGRNSPRRDITATRAGSYEDIPLAVLIDEGSASASEIIAGAVQDNDRGWIVGRRSFGKGLVQEQVDLPDHSAVRLTTARYYTASGRSIQRPYGEGIAYNDDLAERYEHGEFLSADSVRLDSSQMFTTVGGRKVFGGGGVMPDLFVPADTSGSSDYLSRLVFSGLLNRFAFDVADRDRNMLERYGSPEAFQAKYRVTDALIDELVRLGVKEGVPEDPAGVARSRKVLAARIKSGIARNIWGNAGYYRILLDDDRIFQRAVERLRSGDRP
jgi:carboxyl-terminal processing protease